MASVKVISGFKHKLKTIAAVTTGGTLVFFGVGVYQGNESFFRNIIMPLVHELIDPEKAHRLAVISAKYGIFTSPKQSDTDIMRLKVWNLQFSNPIGLAAGFDKHGEAVAGVCKMGFGFIEVGSVTPEPQAGNSKPRVFRLIEDKAVINRYGFNSDGHEAVYRRLKELPAQTGIVLGINLGKNKTSESAASDYAKGVERFAQMADFTVINISSPNTPGLRNMQKKAQLDQLMDAVITTGKKHHSRGPILIKIAPDLTMSEMNDIVDVALSKGIDGIVVSNTTVSRPSSLMSPQKTEEGGLSGKPLKDMATEAIKNIYTMTNGKLPIIGVGGISSGQDAYEKIRAGASLVELYTALVYEGPPVVVKIKRELQELLEKDGFLSVSDAIGVEHRKKKNIRM